MEFRKEILFAVLQLLAATVSARSVLGKRVISSSLPVNWTYSGCYLDRQDLRTLSGYAMYQNTTGMTQESCINYCASRGFVHSGVEYMYECYCGNDDLTKETAAPETDCNMQCSGNATETCGAGDRLSVFTSNQKPTSPATTYDTGLWSLYGCFKEGINGRALVYDENDTPGGETNMSVASCVYSCQRNGYLLAGLEDANQCFCGNEFSNKAVPDVGGFKYCNLPCSGNSTELCGGPDRLDVYGFNNTVPNPISTTSSSMSSTSTSSLSTSSSLSTASPTDVPSTISSNTISSTSSSSVISSANTAAATPSWYAIGCYNDAVGSRTLANQQYGDANIMTNEVCIQKCASSGYTFSGTEYYSECYCDSQIRNGMNLATDPTSCNTACQGNSSEFCGGGDRLTMFRYGIKGAASVVSSSTSSTISETATVVSSSAASTASSSASSWKYLGCYTDGVGGRSLSSAVNGQGGIMTNQLCQSACQKMGFTLAGTEYSGECYCDNKLQNGGGPALDGEQYCNMNCNGDATQKCGGGNRLSLYSFSAGTGGSSSSSLVSSSSQPSSTSSAAIPQSTSAWTSLGCYNDTVGSRTLMNQIYGNGNVMTVELCQSSCKSGGYTLMGAEYGGECYCDTTFHNYGAPATDGCNMACNGNSQQLCGGGNRLNVYRYTPLAASSSSSSLLSTSSMSLSPTIVSMSTTSTVSPSSISLSSSALSSSTESSISSTSTSSASQSSVVTFTSSSNTLSSSSASLSSSRHSVVSTSSDSLSSGSPSSSSILSISSSLSSRDSSSVSSSPSSIPSTLVSSKSLTSSSGSPGVSSSTSLTSSSTILASTTSSITSTDSSSSSLSQTSSSPTLVSGSSSSTQTSSSSTLFSSSSPTTSFVSSDGAAASSSSTSASASPTMSIGWYSLGCYAEGNGGRTLGYGLQVPGGGNNMTVENCQTVCLASKYTLAGVEYAGECYCDTVFRNGGGPASDGDTNCNMACNGNKTETCGGPDRLNMYSYYSGPTPTGTSTTSAAVTTTKASGATAIPSGWSYSGCYIDGANGRIMQNQQNDNQQLTIESCVQTCAGLGYSVAGMEYSVQCFCDNFIRNGAALATADTQCNIKCGGNSAENCGAGSRVSIYNMGNLTMYQPPAPQTSKLPGNWSYAGCLTDDNDNRSLKYRITNMVNNNTATNCLSLCSTFGYPAGGMEFGSECYCGDLADVANAGATMRPDSECVTPCSGDPMSICGAGGRISYYVWNSSDLYSWNRPMGNDAGQYQFLIGGVVIPLVTQQTIKGKVTFLEKHGTGAPNTTGAYELDLAQLDNFKAAWRTMHVKTDVFCSASLTLPDKAGRQINLGGWANDDTFGIRLYTPSGSPGVAGTTDWQENVNEVKLLNGRWYPTAAIMPSGIILIVGGEEGSNGAPVPTLETIPSTVGALYCDWLDRTDPYNLYPFIIVLPHGGVFVGYYNEARILDQNTFATQRVLPNMPGAVNDFDGGRTYPFEGTAVSLPQHAPYDEAFTILVCGGSTPGPEIALDNCVSLQPEVANANWTIERMPSSRVISCMTALPDGTYLILNGGQQGRAGFGLTVNPNHNAVLYDPSKPINHRMSVMANTTIDRLYHSEAILLQDGRVLVSGSDPEDERFVQEYRVEVFVPPYLLSGLPRPTFNLTDTDWAYGTSHTLTVTSGNVANMRVSLLGAEASTHGNSMGQRTIFPAVSCSGTTCTITAPPNSNICPPGWFQLFLLDGPTPSTSVYVRIGGDPAGLGNWPNFPDFMPLPGV